MHARPSSIRSLRSRTSFPLALALAAGLAACGGGSSGSSGGSSALGSILTKNDGTNFVVESNFSGSASRIRLLDTAWGRLVDVFDTDGNTSTLRFRDWVIGRDIQTDGVDFRLDRNSVTGVEVLTILHPFDANQDGVVDPAFRAALTRSTQNLQSIQPFSSPLTMTARNSVLVLVFDDLLEESTINSNTVRVFTGNPPTSPFEARVIPDPNHGDGSDTNGDGLVDSFRTTRVIVDFTVSELEQLAATQPLNVNTVGLPEALDRQQPNVRLRLPTRVDLTVGQFEVLTNTTAHPLDFSNNGATDPASNTRDIVRDFRSGGSRFTPPDPFNGFLPDTTPPDVIGSQAITVTLVQQQTTTDFLVDFQFQAAPCVAAPEIGDVVRVGAAIGEILANLPPPPPGSTTVTNVPIRLRAGDAGDLLPGPGLFLAPFEPAESDVPACFVSFSPQALSPPTSDVQPFASALVRFSEPMDPGRFEAFKTMTVTKPPSPTLDLLQENIVGRVQGSLDLLEYRFVPTVQMPHVNGTAESYLFTLIGGAQGVTDLAGNALVNDLPQVPFTLSAFAPTADTFGQVFRFGNDDQDGDGAPEFRGQFLLDVAATELKPRGLTRFGALADGGTLTTGAMTPFGQSIATPLSPFGSHMMTIYRYPDLGFPLLDETGFNLDVEGLNWAPFSGVVSIDNFSEYQISVGHSRRLPDESLNMALLPLYPNSGILTVYNNNLLDNAVIMHPRPLGYSINPLNAFLAPSGTTMMPWPINEDVPPEQFTFFTWRDTTELGVGGPQGGGADMPVLYQLMGIPAPPAIYPPGQVPTIGLPLLMDFRCYPDDQAVGLNGFQIALVLNTSPRPEFRAFSTGGVDTTNTIQRVDPDNDVVAQGGYSPGSTPPGLPTPPRDNSFYFGQVDFVVRVSVVHTIWFDSGSTTGQANWQPPAVEPRPSAQPTGTQIVLAFRGADTVADASAGSGASRDATNLDMYGNNGPSFSVTFFNGGDNSWKDAIDDVDGARHVQTRISLVSNPFSGLTPRLQGFGLAAIR